MTRSTTFVLGRALAPLSHWRAHPLRHWRRWRHGGIAISAALHVALLAAFTVSLPRLERAQIRDAQAVPVEIVKPPERAQDKAGEVAKPKPPETAKDKRDAPAATKTPEPPAAPRSAAPQPARAAPPPSVRALLQPRQVPGAQRWTMPRPPPFPSATMPSEPRAPSETPDMPPDPRAAPGEKVALDDSAPPPRTHAPFGRWVLAPLTLRPGHECGAAHLTAVIELNDRLGEGSYRGIMRRRIDWDRCPPEGMLYEVELRINGSEVLLLSDGFTDRGVIRGGVMMLEDAYGRSVWNKR